MNVILLFAITLFTAFAFAEKSTCELPAGFEQCTVSSNPKRFVLKSNACDGTYRDVYYECRLADSLIESLPEQPYKYKVRGVTRSGKFKLKKNGNGMVRFKVRHSEQVDSSCGLSDAVKRIKAKKYYNEDVASGKMSCESPLAQRLCTYGPANKSVSALRAGAVMPCDDDILLVKAVAGGDPNGQITVTIDRRALIEQLKSIKRSENPRHVGAE